MDVPVTCYADTERGAIAFQVVGDGPLTILVNKPPGLPLDLMWEEPSLARFMTGLGSFSRSIWFDPLGTGSSDALRRSRTGSLRESSPTWRACSMPSTVNARWCSASAGALPVHPVQRDVSRPNAGARVAQPGRDSASVRTTQRDFPMSSLTT